MPKLAIYSPASLVHFVFGLDEREEKEGNEDYDSELKRLQTLCLQLLEKENEDSKAKRIANETIECITAIQRCRTNFFSFNQTQELAAINPEIDPTSFFASPKYQVG